MAEQTLTIPTSTLFSDAANEKRWDLNDSDAILIDTALEDVVGAVYLRRFIVKTNANGVELRMVFAPTTTIGTSQMGDDLSDAWEVSGQAIGVTQGANSVAAIPGPNFPSNHQTDSSETYIWIIAAGAMATEVETFFFTDLVTSADFSLTLRDTALPATNVAVELTGADAGATTAAQIAVTVATVTNVDVELTGADAGATTAAQIAATVMAAPEPLPRTVDSLLPNFPYWKVSGGVDYAVREALNALDLTPVANWYDPDQIPEPVIGAIMDFYGVSGLDTTIFGLDFRRNVLAANAALRRFRGTEFVLQEFSAATGVTYTYTIGRDVDTGDADSIVFTVTPPLNVVPFANWQAYMRRAFRWLIPPKLSLAAFQVTLYLVGEFYQYSGARFHTVMQGI